MQKRPRRGSFVALATGLFLILSFSSTPSVPSVPAPEPPPDLAEIAALEEIADWLVGNDTDHRALRWTDLADPTEGTPQTFELFRRVTDEASRKSFLIDLPYGDQIFETAERHRLDSLLVAALVEVESSFLAHAVSPVGAQGLMQVMPATGGDYGGPDLLDPEANLDVGAQYLSDLLERYDGDLELALAAYNAGPANVKRYGGVPPFPETRHYVERVLSIYVDHHRNVWDASGATEMLLLR